MRIHTISCVDINPLDDCTNLIRWQLVAPAGIQLGVNNLIWLLFIDYKTATARIKKKLKKGTRTTFFESVLVMPLQLPQPTNAGLDQ